MSIWQPGIGVNEVVLILGGMFPMSDLWNVENNPASRWFILYR